jgi:hypothetical protein
LLLDILSTSIVIWAIAVNDDNIKIRGGW